MSNARHATGMVEEAAQAAQAAGQDQDQDQGPSVFQLLQGLPAPIRPAKVQMGLGVEVVPNPNLASEARKLIMVTVVRSSGVEFIGFEPNEWDGLAEMVQARMAEARSTLEVAKPGDLAGLPPALRRS